MEKSKVDNLQKAFMFFMAICSLVVGLYFEYMSCFAVLLLCLFLIYIKRKSGHLYFRLNDASMAVIILVMFYGISVFYAVDTGLAVWGFFKFLPLFLFLLVIFQVEKEERLSLFWQIPYVAAATTVASFILSIIPQCKEFFLVNGRLGGFFQYPNTFAMYLLVGLIVLYAGDIRYADLYKKILTLILITGILFSQSRTVIILGIAAAITLWLIREKKEKAGLYKKSIFLLIGVFLIGIVLSAISYKTGLLDNFLENHFYFSTFWGRLLYFQDALGQIIRHPFGMGYMGYYLTQSQFQSGVYSVMFVHNDLLQIMLDVGWIPGICFIIAVLKSLLSKGQYQTQKLVLIFMILHCMFDFDLQYVYMFFLLLLTWDIEQEKQYQLPAAVLPIMAFLAIAGVYIGAGNLVYYTGNLETAYKIYQWNTFAEVRMLSSATEPKSMEEMANQILGHNENIAVAWDAKAKAAYSRGIFSEVIEYKKKALELAPYDISIYEDYFSMLATGIELYEAMGDTKSIEICQKEILSLQKLLDEIKEATSSLAWKTVDPPQLEMSEKYQKYVENLK